MTDFTILSIDIGSTFGYAVGKNGVIVESGEVSLSPGASKVHPGHRLLKFQKFLHDTYARYQFNEITFEDINFVTSALQMKVYGRLLGQLEIFSLAYKTRLTALTPGTVKKEFAGSGVAKKQEMCNVAIRLGWKNGQQDTENNHNECDAIALLCVMYKRRNIEPKFFHQAVSASANNSAQTDFLDAERSLAVS